MALITGCRSVNMCCQECYVGIITQRSNINKDVSFTARLSSALYVNCCCSQSQWGETGIIKLPDSIHLGGRDTKTGRRGKKKKKQHKKQDICSLKPTQDWFISPFSHLAEGNHVCWCRAHVLPRVKRSLFSTIKTLDNLRTYQQQLSKYWGHHRECCPVLKVDRSDVSNGVYKAPITVTVRRRWTMILQDWF